MSSAQRAVVVTNNDPGITYAGEWTTIDGSTLSDSGGWGAPFSPTLHITRANSSFSFPFHGSTILVIGTDNVANISTNPDPTWQCFVDGTSLGPPILLAPIQNNWVMCRGSNLSDGLHELTVNVTSHGMPFYLDTLQYQASPGVSLENSLIAIYPGDPAIHYTSGWSFGATEGNETSTPNSLINLTFIGTQLWWYGFLPAGPTSSGEWSIDGGSFQSFQVTNSIPDTSNSGDNQLFFTTPVFDMGTHELSVKYTGTSGQIPLILRYFFIQNGSFSASPTIFGGGDGTRPLSSTAAPNHASPHSSPPPSNHASPPVGSKTGSSTPRIAGGVIGSIVGVAIVVVIAFAWRRQRRKISRGPRSSIQGIAPYNSQPPSVPPLQISQVPKDHASQRNVVSAEYSHPNSINPTSLSPILSSQSSNPPAAIETDSSRYPLPVTAAQPSSTEIPFDSRFIVQYEDIGIRLRSLAAEGLMIEAPPAYTEQ